MQKKKYLQKMNLNLTLAYAKGFFRALYFFMPIWYDFETQFASAAALGTIYAVTHLITVVLELPTGALADLLGRKKTILIGYIIDACGYLIISQAQDVSWIWLGYAVNAFGTALISGADVALNYDSLKELGKEDEFSQFSSKWRIIHRIGMILAIFLGGYIYKFMPRMPYILAGLSRLVIVGLIFFNTEPKIDTEKFSFKSYIKQTKEGFKQLFKNEYIRDFSFFYILVGGITWYFLYFLTQAFATEIGFSAIERSWLFSAIYIVGEFLILYLLSNNLLKRRTVYLMFPMVMIVGFLPGAFVGKLGAIPILFLLQIISSARFSILNQYSNLEFESKYRATAISSLNMAVSIFFALISTISGVFIEEFGASVIMTALGIVTIVLVLPFTYPLVVNHKDRG